MSKFNSIWTAPIAKIGKTRIELHISCVILMACFCLELVALAVPPILLLSCLLLLMFSFFVHELAHVIASGRRATVNLIRMYAFGGMRLTSITSAPSSTDAPDLKTEPSSDILRLLSVSILAGPIASATLVLIFWQAQLGAAALDLTQLSLVLRSVAEFNLFLAIINILPILPFDLGQYAKLRTESNPQNYARFIQLATFASWLMVGLAVYYNHFALALVSVHAVFVMLQESFITKARKTLGNSSVREAMINLDQVQILSQAMSISAAADLTSKSFQAYFPVKNSEILIGFVNKEEILQAYASGKEESLGSIVHREYLTVQLSDSLVDVIRRVEEIGAKLLFVLHDGKPVGLLLKDKLTEYLMVSSIRSRNNELDQF